jgi:hypothetical protein
VPSERRRPRRPTAPFRPASPNWKPRESCHSRLTCHRSLRWPTSPLQPCSPTQIDRQTVRAFHPTPHPLPARAPALPGKSPCERPLPSYDKATHSHSKPTRLEPNAFTMRQVSSAPKEGHHHEPRRVPTFAAWGSGAKQGPTQSVMANRHPCERRRPRRPTLHPDRPLLSGNTASLAIRASPPPRSPRWPTSPLQPCSPTQIDRQTVNFLHTTPHPLPARAPALPGGTPPRTTYRPDGRLIGLGGRVRTHKIRQGNSAPLGAPPGRTPPRTT